MEEKTLDFMFQALSVSEKFINLRDVVQVISKAGVNKYEISQAIEIGYHKNKLADLSISAGPLTNPVNLLCNAIIMGSDFWIRLHDAEAIVQCLPQTLCPHKWGEVKDAIWHQLCEVSGYSQGLRHISTRRNAMTSLSPEAPKVFGSRNAMNDDYGHQWSSRRNAMTSMSPEAPIVFGRRNAMCEDYGHQWFTPRDAICDDYGHQFTVNFNPGCAVNGNPGASFSNCPASSTLVKVIPAASSSEPGLGENRYQFIGSPSMYGQDCKDSKIYFKLMDKFSRRKNPEKISLKELGQWCKATKVPLNAKKLRDLYQEIYGKKPPGQNILLTFKELLEFLDKACLLGSLDKRIVKEKLSNLNESIDGDEE